MKNQTQLFENKDFGKLEVLTIGDKPFFPATECAKILGYKNPRDAIAKHCKSDGVAKCDGVSATTNQHGKVTEQRVEKIYITEGNLYRLIVRSKLPSAEKFSDWIFEEVMPAIRKHGAYITEDVLKRMLESSEYTANLLKNLSTEYIRNQKLECKIMELTPKADYYDSILQSDDVIPITIIAKNYSMSAVEFNQLLNGLGIQYKVGGTWVLYKKYSGKGYTRTKTFHINENENAVRTYWTMKGCAFLFDLLKWYGIEPNIDLDEDEDDTETAFEESLFDDDWK